jgi:hypothetical protein
MIGIDIALRKHIAHAIETTRAVPIGQGYDWQQRTAQTRLGHTAEGWYVMASWPTPEGYDDDAGSRSCRCTLAGRSHRGVHRIAETLEDLLDAPTERGCY